ncbi:hypothetical protein C0991_008724 [Blastosporella zonata]|nr:hypothetical protein C0991_008724 [Blastosporella zonata]
MSMHNAPPPYYARQTPPVTAFLLPSYHDAMGSDTWDVPSCLPPYQARTGQRFHPYMRILRDADQTESFQTFYRSLQTSSVHSLSPQRCIIPTVLNEVVAPPTAPFLPVAQALPLDREERLRLLFRRVLAVVPELIQIIRAALGAADLHL